MCTRPAEHMQRVVCKTRRKRSLGPHVGFGALARERRPHLYAVLPDERHRLCYGALSEGTALRLLRLTEPQSKHNCTQVDVVDVGLTTTHTQRPACANGSVSCCL